MFTGVVDNNSFIKLSLPFGGSAILYTHIFPHSKIDLKIQIHTHQLIMIKPHAYIWKISKGQTNLHNMCCVVLALIVWCVFRTTNSRFWYQVVLVNRYKLRTRHKQSISWNVRKKYSYTSQSLKTLALKRTSIHFDYTHFLILGVGWSLRSVNPAALIRGSSEHIEYTD